MISGSSKELPDKPSILLMYHFFHPDDVVSARHFTQFAEGLRDKNWQVTVLTSNRYCRYQEKSIACRDENWNGIRIVRVYRPNWNQANNYLRLLNTLYIMVAWSLRSLFIKRQDVIVVGTDPQFAALIFPFLRILGRGKILVHWCFDLYPEAIIADGSGILLRLAAKVTKLPMKIAYKFVDVMVDIGFCMRTALQKYHHSAKCETLIPWALVEPDKIPDIDQNTREGLFGKNASLTILYSGNMGKAHDFEQFVDLARRVRKKNSTIIFCFACRGNRYDELVSYISEEDHNIKFAGFASEDELEKRLGAADIHLVSLKQEWTGIVVPSKFFGCLAVGKPIIFNGPSDSAIAKWLEEYDIGWVLNPNTINDLTQKLIDIAENPQKIQDYTQRAFATYQEHFSKQSILDKWHSLLIETLHK